MVPDGCAPMIDMCHRNMRQVNCRHHRNGQRVDAETSFGHEGPEELVFSVLVNMSFNRKQVHNSAVHEKNGDAEPAQKGDFKETEVQVSEKPPEMSRDNGKHGECSNEIQVGFVSTNL